jgi:hypothetical protein
MILRIHSSSGRTSVLDVDPTGQISDIKAFLERTLCMDVTPTLTFKGHELRDHRSLWHYGIGQRDTLYVCKHVHYFHDCKEAIHFDIAPQSNIPRTSLCFEDPDGGRFMLDVNSDIKVTQLYDEILFEEKLVVHHLKFLSLSDGRLIDLPVDASISQFPLSSRRIFMFGPSIPLANHATMDIHVRLGDGRILDIMSMPHHTLNEFKEAVRSLYDESLSDVLVLLGQEINGNGTISELGFFQGCIIHSGKLTSFVATPLLMVF